MAETLMIEFQVKIVDFLVAGYPSLEAMPTNVQAVAIFTSTFDHRRVVETCAPRGIHCMMEKPLAVNTWR